MVVTDGGYSPAIKLILAQATVTRPAAFVDRNTSTRLGRDTRSPNSRRRCILAPHVLAINHA